VIDVSNQAIKLKHYTNCQCWGDIALSKKAMWSRKIGEKEWAGLGKVAIGQTYYFTHFYNCIYLSFDSNTTQPFPLIKSIQAKQ
jgi:hypothetical protein